MKKIFASIVLTAALGFTATAQITQPANDIKPQVAESIAEKLADAQMVFDYTEYDYGDIEQGSDGVRVFPFVNKGTEPLIIKTAKGSCGCTVPTYPKEPILPGERGEIKVKYDTKRLNSFSKSVTLTTNGSETPIILRIKGNVKAVEEPAAVPTKSNSILKPE